MSRAEDNSRSVSGMTLNDTEDCTEENPDIAAPCTKIITIIPICWTLE